MCVRFVTRRVLGGTAGGPGLGWAAPSGAPSRAPSSATPHRKEAWRLACRDSRGVPANLQRSVDARAHTTIRGFFNYPLSFGFMYSFGGEAVVCWRGKTTRVCVCVCVCVYLGRRPSTARGSRR